MDNCLVRPPHYIDTGECKASDTPGDFIRRSPMSAIQFAGISHLAKCARSRDFLRSSLRITSKFNQSGWAILSHDFSKRPSMEPGNKVEVPHCRDRRIKSPGVKANEQIPLSFSSWKCPLQVKKLIRENSAKNLTIHFISKFLV